MILNAHKKLTLHLPLKYPTTTRCPTSYLTKLREPSRYPFKAENRMNQKTDSAKEQTMKTATKEARNSVQWHHQSLHIQRKGKENIRIKRSSQKVLMTMKIPSILVKGKFRAKNLPLNSCQIHTMMNPLMTVM